MPLNQHGHHFYDITKEGPKKGCGGGIIYKTKKRTGIGMRVEGGWVDERRRKKRNRGKGKEKERITQASRYLLRADDNRGQCRTK